MTDFIITIYDSIVCSGKTNAFPRIGETIWIYDRECKVQDVVWHCTDTMYVEIKSMYC